MTTGAIALIPARGGSKRIPRKNIRDFCGQPMISWPIAAAKKSGLFDRIIVSTDDAEIAEVAKRSGAEVPFVRGAELSDDQVGLGEVIAHATRWILDRGWRLDALCCILATAPLIDADDLKRGFRALMARDDWQFAFSATDFPSPIFRSFFQRPEGGIEMFFPEHYATRSQDLPVALHDAAQFYWGRPEAWREHKRVFDHHSVPVMIPRWRVQDVDTEEDWQRAEMLFRAQEVVRGAK
jgi:N-acylneuraminate cytidylyltransferase